MKHHIRIAAHMGTHCANIPGNTPAAFEIALRQGADIVELDVTRSADDRLYIFHPGTERRCLGVDLHIDALSANEIQKLRFLNEFDEPTAYGLMTLEEALAMLKGRCIINIDKFQDNPAAIAQSVRAMGMQDQVIVKTDPRPELFDQVAQTAWDLPYMPFVYEKDACFEQLSARRDIRYRGVEAVFSTDDAELATDAYLQRMHALGKEVWINAIRFNDARPLAGSHVDDGAMTGDPEEHWGWMGRKGYDIIQTDWVLPLFLYLRAKGW